MSATSDSVYPSGLDPAVKLCAKIDPLALPLLSPVFDTNVVVVCAWAARFTVTV